MTSWTRSLRARSRSASTISGYVVSARKLAEHAEAHDLDPLTREAVESFLAELTERVKPATVAFRYRSLRQFFGWLVAEEELDDAQARRRSSDRQSAAHTRQRRPRRRPRRRARPAGHHERRPAAGEHIFYCRIGNHRQAGMELHLTVK